MLGKEHPDTLGSMTNLAEVLSSQGKYEEAEKMHRQALALRETMLGEEHPNFLLLPILFLPFTASFLLQP